MSGDRRARWAPRVRRLPVGVRVPVAYGWSLVRGEWPAPVAYVVGRVRTRSPRTYNEKIRYKMVRDRRPLLSVFAEKLTAREYAAARIDAGYLMPVLAVAGRGDEVPWGELPEQFVVKVTHGSGGIVVVDRSADPAVRLPSPRDRPGWSRHRVHPDCLDRVAVAALLDYWLTLGYGWVPGRFQEHCYLGIPRRIVVEPFLGTAAGPPRELKVICLNGEPRASIVLVKGADFKNTSESLFLTGEEDDARQAAGLAEDGWSRLLDACRALAAEIDLVRVDWFLPTPGPLLGELTVFPTAGRVRLVGHRTKSPDEIDHLLGAWWTLPEAYA